MLLVTSDYGVLPGNVAGRNKWTAHNIYVLCEPGAVLYYPRVSPNYLFIDTNIHVSETVT